MSRKENSLNNGMMRNFFGTLKTEMFYVQERKYKTLDDLIKIIYIYNYNRIKVKLKKLSPVNYGLQSANYKLFINCQTFWFKFNLWALFLSFD